MDKILSPEEWLKEYSLYPFLNVQIKDIEKYIEYYHKETNKEIIREIEGELINYQNEALIYDTFEMPDIARLLNKHKYFLGNILNKLK